MMHAPGFSAAVVIVALIVDGVLGSFKPMAAPDAALVTLARRLVARLDRADRSPATRRVRGGLLLLALAAAAASFGLLIEAAVHLSRGLQPLLPLALATGFGLRRAVDRVRRLPQGNQSGEPWRVAAASLPAAFATGLLGGALWFAIAGLAGVLAWRVVLAVAEATRGRGEVSRVAVLVNGILLLPPALLASLFYLAAGLFLPAARPAAALRAVPGDRTLPLRQRLAPNQVAFASLGLNGRSPGLPPASADRRHPMAAVALNRLLALQGIATLLAIAALAAMAML